MRDVDIETAPSQEEPSEPRIESLETVRGGSPGLDSQLLLARARSKLLGRRSIPVAIGRYEIIEKVGSGGMGVVYSARDPDLDRQVAIKVLRSELDEHTRGRTRLIREAQALAKLSHPNVVHVYEVGEHEDQVYLVMEFVAGKTLRHWLRENDPDATEVLRLFVEAGRGLLAAHRAGVVHRDFKPDNVLVGPDRRPRVMDFGLARPTFELEELPSQEIVSSHDEWNIPTDENEINRRMTVTGTVLGTPAYMDPQQLMGATADAVSDQYAFCVSLFEGLYGERPYQGSTVTELIKHMDTREPVDVDVRGRGVPGTVQRALVKGLEFTRDKRHASFEELLAILEQALEPKPRRRVLPWVLAVGGLAAAAGLVAQSDPAPAPAATISTPSEPAEPHAELLATSHLPDVVPEPIPGDPTNVTVHRLQNGLTVYVAPRSDEPKVAVRMLVRAGVMNEPEGAAGVAALTRLALEAGGAKLGVVDPEAEAPFLAQQHEALTAMAATSDPKVRAELAAQADRAYRQSMAHLAPGDLPFIRGQIGAGEIHEEFNAGTDWCVHVPSTRFETWIRAEAEMIRNPSFRGLPMAAARTAEHFRFEYEGSEVFVQMERLLARAFGHGPNPDAELETMGRIPLEEVRRFHQTYYRPNNMALVLVGDITPERALPVIEAAFGDWAPGPLPPPPLLQDEPWREVQRFEGTSPIGDEVWVGWSVPPTNDGSRSLLEAFSSVLTGPDGLLTALLEKHPRLIDGRLMLLERGLVVTASPTRGMTHAEAEAALTEVMEDIAHGRVPDEIWERALARQRLDAVRWSRSAEALSLTISESFLYYRQWDEVAASLLPRDVEPEDLSALAKRLLERGAAVIHARPGPPWMPAAAPLPYASPPDRARQSARSPFAQSVVDLPASELEPRFISEGMHFERSSWGDAQIITARTKGPVFHLGIVYDHGVADDPFVCSAARMRALQWTGERSRALASTDVWVECGVTDTTFHFTALSDELPDVWDEVWRRLADTTVEEESLARELDFEMHYRQEARNDTVALADALHSYGALGPRSIHRNLPTDAQMERVTPGRLQDSLDALASRTPTVLFSGPDPDRIRERLPEPMGPSTRSQPMELAAGADETTVYLVDVPGADQVDLRISVMWPMNGQRDHLLADLYEAHPPPGIDATFAEQGMVYRPSPPAELAPSRKPVRGWGYRVDHESALTVMRAAFAELASGPRPDAFGDARANLQNGYRTERVVAENVPSFVRNWNDADAANTGIDPRIQRWVGLGRLQYDDFARFARQIGQTPVVVTVLADLSRLDVDALRAFGKVVRPAPADVLRDPELTDSGLWYGP